MLNSPGGEIKIYFFHGKGSSGKDTQAKKFTEGNPAAVKISTGDMLRDAEDPENRHHALLAPHIEAMKSGTLIPDEVIVEAVRREIGIEQENFVTEFFITGFPRTDNQLVQTDSMITEMRKTQPVNDKHIYLAVHDNTARSRAEGRRSHAIQHDRPTRHDDEPTVVTRRLDVFRDHTWKMINRLHNEARLTIVKATGGIDEVRAKLGIRLEGPTFPAVPENQRSIMEPVMTMRSRK